ncbi:hypothetical protein GIB67_030264 [Kingdonia uniflora]|uniref:E3 SUMO-protein ligase SIZ1 n=1 Tax=Kingdonia uniflora TaxID=39325 RepID=A0A7J7M6F9_9MAGN|nr:hypothetical protein GIB67_030264 [Kingdonia uniflora]
MDLVSTCKDKLQYFRIKELKEVLTQLGLAKQGKKQDLVDRILSTLSDDSSKAILWAKQNSLGKEGVAKIIDDTHRKMQVHGATELASNRASASDINNVKPKEEPNDSFQLDMKVRCPCGSSLLSESMIQCDDPRCHVWQHKGCVIIPEKPMEGISPDPPHFYCEICRLSRADPFWVTVAHPLLPVKLSASILPTDGTNAVQNIEKTFQLTRADRDLLQKAENDVQAWCILLNDKVPFRMQWPQFTDLQVNGVPVRTTNRPGSQLLGANGRDDGPAITTCTREGINKISLSGCDARIFCLGVRIGKQRTVQQVLNMIPKEADGERFEDALVRVCRCIGGGGTAAENADSDSDLEVVADSVTVNLRCPMSGSRMKIAGRFRPCAHMGCFDLETFIELNQRSRKASISNIWQCPICLKNYSLENIIIDSYFNRIMNMMRDCSEDVNEIDVKPDGSWRVKNENECRELAQWHFPNGSLCVPEAKEVNFDLGASKQLKEEGVSEGICGLRFGLKKNENGVWEVSKPEGTCTPSFGNRLEEKLENRFPKVMPLSGSASESCKDGDDPSVNQEGNELNSNFLNFDPIPNMNFSAPLANGVIVLSDDSDGDNENFTTAGNVYDSGEAIPGIPFSVPAPGIPDPYLEDSGRGLGLFNGSSGDDFVNPLWPLAGVNTQVGPGFQLFGTETNISESLGDPTSVAGYTFAPDTDMAQIPDSICHSNSDLHSSLVDNPLAFGGEDPALQIFLPSHPAGTLVQPDLRNQPDSTDGMRTDDWISLRLGGSGVSAAANGFNSSHHFRPVEDRKDNMGDTASLHPCTNDDRSDRTSSKRQHSDSTFSCPRQSRPVRPCLYLSIDSDTE